MNISMAINTTQRSACVRVAGDIDYETIDGLVDTASQLLAEYVDLANLHLDFARLTFLDSAALSGLLLIHRRTSHSGVRLHLDHRPPFLDRVLQVTGLFEHFVSSRSDATSGAPSLSGRAGSTGKGIR